LAQAAGVPSRCSSFPLVSANVGFIQSVDAYGNFTFFPTRPSSIPGDAGDVDVTADTGFILAQTVLSNGVQTQGSVQANGSASLSAATTNTGITPTTGNGSRTLTGERAVNMTSFTLAHALARTSSRG